MYGSKENDLTPTLKPPPITPSGGMIISLGFSVRGFSDRWSHCHQMANYLARFASANEDDPERHATYLSTLFNELLEAIYRNHAHQGQIKINFTRGSSAIALHAQVPVNDQSSVFYKRAVELVRQPDPMSWYRDLLEHGATDDEATVLGLLELSVVYEAKISITEPEGANSVYLEIEFPLTEVTEP